MSSEDAVKFKSYMNADKIDFNMSKPTHPMHYDRDFDFMKDRNFWMSMIVLLMTGMYLKARLIVEKDRWHMWDRKDNLANGLGHHYHNRGGILIRKQFAGFEKYHRNHNDLMSWTTKAFPTAFPAKE